MKAKDLKLVVQEKYSAIAKQTNTTNDSSCCSTGECCSTDEYSVFSENYKDLAGYNPDADLGLGCGIPTEFAGIKKGDHVLDLGSGAGNDCFVARAIVGETGKVTGLDFTDAMLSKATANAAKLGYANIEFIKGDIEEMPLPANEYDVVVSNCVLNLVPDKNKAFTEIMRVLKPGGHFCVSDVVIKGNLPEKLRKDAEMYAGCVSGALRIEEYLEIIYRKGFENVFVHKQKEIFIPDDILKKYYSRDELINIDMGTFGLFSITVSGHKS